MTIPEDPDSIVPLASVPRLPVASLAPDPDAELFAYPDPVAIKARPDEPAKPRARAKPSTRRPKPRPAPQHSPEHKRALEITAIYQMTQPVCDEAKATFAIRTAILCGQWPDEEIVAAVQRVADAGYPLTSNTLGYQLQKREPADREVDPVIHQAIDTALEHLGRLDSETISETEQALAAAVRSLAVAMMHKAKEGAQ